MGISCFGGPSAGLQVFGKGNARCLAELTASLNAHNPGKIYYRAASAASRMALMLAA